MLALAPTDGEAQLLLATLLRRVGRTAEAKRALEQLSRSDSGAAWQAAIARELVLLEHSGRDEQPEQQPRDAVIPMASGGSAEASTEKAA